MDTKKTKDTIAVLEAQLDSAYERVDDPFYTDQKAHLACQIIKLEDEIRKFKNRLK